MHSSPQISIKDLRLKVAGRRLWGDHALSASFESGRLNLLWGANGAGKTTLARLLAMRSRQPFEGEILRSGHARPSDIAFLPQESADLEDVTAKEFFSVAHATATIGSFHTKRRFGELSGGQRRRVLVDLVSAQSQPVHIYDEPFRGLDAAMREHVWNALAGIVERGRLVIAVVHAGDVPRGSSLPIHSIDLDELLKGGIR
jgi:ABC-type multidrug transport system ATPase subunit